MSHRRLFEQLGFSSFGIRALPVLLASLALGGAAASQTLAESLGELPLAFERNDGQTDARVRYLARGPGYALFLSGSEANLALQGSGGAVLRMSFVAASDSAAVRGLQPLPGKVNYLRGPDPSKFLTGIPTFGRVRVDDVYPGIDVEYYGNQGELEYDFIVAPGADPSLIRIRFKGVDAAEIDGKGDLVLRLGKQRVVQRKPVLYQQIDGERQPVAGSYRKLSDATFGFEVGGYDKQRPLVIDPILIYSTFVGGPGRDDTGRFFLASDGSHYGIGNTSSVFPKVGGLAGSVGANLGHWDVVIYKLNPSGSALVFSTYVSGNSEDIGDAIVLDAEKNIFVAISTHSTNYPVQIGSFQGNQGTRDAYLAKLSPAGDAILASTYVGGSGEENVSALLLDSAGDVCICGATQSSNFPVTSGAAQTTHGGVYDSYLAKFTPDLTTQIFGTFIGGSNDEQTTRSLHRDPAGRFYIVGRTRSTTGFATSGAAQSSFGGGATDAFLARISADGSSIDFVTYLGGSGNEEPGNFNVDSQGNVWIAGSTASADFPKVNALQSAHGGISDAFLTRVKGDGTTILYSTLFGGNGGDAFSDVALDSSGAVYVVGWTQSTNLTTTTGALQISYGGGLRDGIMATFSADGQSLLFSTYLGGSSDDLLSFVRMDSARIAHVSGMTSSTFFPTFNPLQYSIAGGQDIVHLKLAGIVPFPAEIITKLQTEVAASDLKRGVRSQLLAYLKAAARILPRAEATAAVLLGRFVVAVETWVTDPLKSELQGAARAAIAQLVR